MVVIYIDESPSNSFYERQLPTGVYRYEGYHSTVKYCIDSPVRKTEEEIEKLLNKWSIEFLIDREGYVITLS
jgi:hypothetical protein